MEKRVSESPRTPGQPPFVIADGYQSFPLTQRIKTSRSYPWFGMQLGAASSRTLEKDKNCLVMLDKILPLPGSRGGGISFSED